MSNNEQSSVEFLFDRFLMLFLFHDGIPEELQEAYEQAKKKHRKEIIESRQNGLDNGFSNGNWDSNLYYQMEFGGENE
jgi:hypothetical protein|tara:strand:- start:136 stop:369 length:234 start_codon:yes stop_codon:yes gene_type:complete